ncbi:phosphohistidine phosphatase, partial [Escherichia coli]|nr:phosphohistidine phosphatase [Escherichia coli]
TEQMKCHLEWMLSPSQISLTQS